MPLLAARGSAHRFLAEVICVVLYAIRETSVLGAILIAAYLGVAH